MFSFLRRKPYRAEAAAVYQRLAKASRAPEFYRDLGVPDSFDGRFEMAVLHAFLVMHRLQNETDGPALNQAIFDAMFGHFDLTLREMGVQDLGVGRRIKQMADAFNGRSAAYRQALADNDRAKLEAALARNIFGQAAPTTRQLDRLTDYVLAADRALAGQERAAILRGLVDLPAIAPA